MRDFLLFLITLQLMMLVVQIGSSSQRVADSITEAAGCSVVEGRE